MSEIIKDTLTEKIISCAFKVHSTLGPGFREINYHNALIIVLNDIGLKYDSERRFELHFMNKRVGVFIFSIPFKIPACCEKAPILLSIGFQVYCWRSLLTSLKKLMPQV